MQFSFTEAQEKFREEVSSFLQAELKAGSFTTVSSDLVQWGSREFSLKLAEQGWIGMTWPGKRSISHLGAAPTYSI